LTDFEPAQETPWNVDETARFADLVVSFAANVQPDQIVAIEGEVGQEWLIRALADASYKAGARFVEAVYFDPRVKRSRLEHAPLETLSYVPPWLGARVEALGNERAAWIRLRGTTEPSAFTGIDPSRAGLDLLPRVVEVGPVVVGGTVNWTIAPCPSSGWASLTHPRLDVAGLGRQLAVACRLNEPDPVASWKRRFTVLAEAAAKLSERRYRALRFRGPGTDLTVGLLATSEFRTVLTHTNDGVQFVSNLPSEELFTAPDPHIVDGVVRATKPLVIGDAIVEGLELEFRRGVCVRADAETNADALRNLLARDAGASRLGEVALVDGDGRVSATGTVFYETLLDENAASHIALGGGYPNCVGENDRHRVNKSQVHVDVMIGSSEVTVSGVDQYGNEQPLLRRGEWVL
jgi:aminopeptidase